MKKLKELENLYDVLDYRNALAVLQATNAPDFSELIEAFLAFRLSLEDIQKSGGNESNIPKKFSALLSKKGCRETSISGDLLVKLKSKRSSGKGYEQQEVLIENFLDGHKIDFIKGRIAFDLEWNSKDQTFDRDLYAFAAFYQANIIDAAVLVTRSESMNEIFKSLGIMGKYGASTTWMGKLEYRINANRSGGCPVLALGITPKLIKDWPNK
ncbi:MAG: restriction endonuclease [Alphaproteobacteria bacterium]|nr:restriction endonuclease [Alphaproteobacteria bacterium]QQS56813.1 MAG: restriction endonuclease [Alphaproteobacteria bacterium]